MLLLFLFLFVLAGFLVDGSTGSVTRQRRRVPDVSDSISRLLLTGLLRAHA